MNAIMKTGVQEKTRLVREIVKLHTSYADDNLINDVSLEEALGVDSIMLASIVVDLNALFEVPATISSQGVQTLDDLTAKFTPYDINESGYAKLDNEYKPGNGKFPVSSENVERLLNVNAAPLTMRDFAGDGNSDLFSKVHKFTSFFDDKFNAGHFWYGMPLTSRCENRAQIYDAYLGKEREFLMFASNNYLGLANDQRVIDAIVNAVREYGATNTGCRLIGGTNRLHLELEEKLAAFKGREACIVFPSGYSANVGTLSALLGRSDTVICDVYNHMSIQDGCKLSGAKKRLYQHNDMVSLENVLKAASLEDGGKLIVADGVFSMHGNIVKLPEIVKLARKYQARILIDDAHSTGVLGKTGSGTTEHFNLKNSVDLELGTMSKALAGMGGFVTGDSEVIDYLRYYANSYVFAATIPAHIAAGLITCLDIIQAEPERLSKLWQNIHYFKQSLDQHGFNTDQSESAIIPIVIGDEELTMSIGREVRKKGMFCQTVVFPGVAVGDARLRISILSEHTRQDLDEAIEILVTSAKEVALPGLI